MLSTTIIATLSIASSTGVHHSTEGTDFNVTWNLNGSEYYTGEAANEYSTSIIGNYTVNFLHDVANGLGIDSVSFVPVDC